MLTDSAHYCAPGSLICSGTETPGTWDPCSPWDSARAQVPAWPSSTQFLSSTPCQAPADATDAQQNHPPRANLLTEKSDANNSVITLYCENLSLSHASLSLDTWSCQGGVGSTQCQALEGRGEAKGGEPGTEKNPGGWNLDSESHQS